MRSGTATNPGLELLPLSPAAAAGSFAFAFSLQGERSCSGEGMLLEFEAAFDLRRDVLPLLTLEGGQLREGNDISEKISETLHIVNVEQSGKIIFTWKGTRGYTYIGLYDPETKCNEVLYTFETDVRIISCSVNRERTLLAVSYLRPTKCDGVNEPLRPVSRCLTLLIEIHPVNNMKVLKAVDSCVRVQFLYPAEMHHFPESHLLLISEDRYIEQFHVSVVTEEGFRVLIQNPGQLPKDRVAEDFIWAQWDMLGQRLFYIIVKDSQPLLKCVQFYPDQNFNELMEMSLDIVLTDTELRELRLVNFGFDTYQDRSLNVHVFASKEGGLCLCYSWASDDAEVVYTVAFLHRGYSKTFAVEVTELESGLNKCVLFLDLDYYIAVYLPGQFLHLLNTRHPDLLCYHLFLTGEQARIDVLLQSPCVQAPLEGTLLDCCSGTLFTVRISRLHLLKLLQNSKLDCQRLAALHCALLYFENLMYSEAQVIQWISDSVSTCATFDPIQEFLVASLYRRIIPENGNLCKLLPPTSVPCWNMGIPGITCTTDIIALPVFKEKDIEGFWESLFSGLEYVNYAESCFHFKTLQRDWCKLITELNTEEKKSTLYHRNILDNAKMVLSHLRVQNSEQGMVPVFEEEVYQQKELIGLIMVRLKDHLTRHLPYLKKDKIDKIALDYVSKLLDLIVLILETAWRKYDLGSWDFCLAGKGSEHEFSVFHIMTCIVEATNGLCVPLPPGFQTLHTMLGIRCLPLHTLLHYVDNGVLQLTETCVTRLLKDLDNTGNNEKLKFSIVTRLPEAFCQKIYPVWDHPVSSSFIAREYVRRLLVKLTKRSLGRRCVSDRTLSVYLDFLPMNYLIRMLMDVEEQVRNPFEEDNVDVKFVEETALKQTTMLLRL
ncbi:gamma-secretase-activating protein isoform X2 [Microcaecilia unicolor]|uniref:Gamma-secretase-activating protein isoform X2 n=1 Tax=Microcaecilia unicolor TaxID=1415580 RepID=A0A6P7Z0R7_9AMPH|nr:gamma-secretase-activating protein isoform X2 [Microcaecilia unicolor]